MIHLCAHVLSLEHNEIVTFACLIIKLGWIVRSLQSVVTMH
jgi:hypothetical protein